jgi:hypothetical protein
VSDVAREMLCAFHPQHIGKADRVAAALFVAVMDCKAGCAVRKLVAAGQAAYLYSLMTPPSKRVRRSR